MFKKVLWLLVLALSLCVPAYAAGTIGVIPADASIADENMIDLPPNYWLEQNFVVLEKPKQLQEYGYMNLRASGAQHGHPSYMELAGKTLKVVKVEKDFPEYKVTFQDAAGRIYVTSSTTNEERLDNIAPVKDMTLAKERWLGKYIYAKRRVINTYDQNLGKFGKINTAIGEPLKVIDIWWGFYETTPLWLVVEKSTGEKGYLETAYSWTNIYKSWWTNARPWEDTFFETDPRTIYDWPEEIWQAISEQRLLQGMTKEQVTLSFGKPKHVNYMTSNSGHVEQWVYGSGVYVYFENGCMTTVQY